MVNVRTDAELEYAIRPAKDTDLAGLAHLYLLAFAATAASEKWTMESARALLSDWLKKQPELFFVAATKNEENDQLIGAIVVGLRPWWDGNHLVDGELFIDPQFQQKGIGAALVKHVLTEAQERYAPTVWETYTFRAEEFPLNWYKKLGFEEIEEWVMIRGPLAKLAARLGLPKG